MLNWQTVCKQTYFDLLEQEHLVHKQLSVSARVEKNLYSQEWLQTVSDWLSCYIFVHCKSAYFQRP